MEIAGLEYCCGVKELGGFADGEEYIGDLYGDAPTPAQIHKAVVDGIKFELRGILNNRGIPSACIATTVNYQKDIMRALKATGFKAVGNTKGNGSRRITLWLRPSKAIK